MEKNKKIDESVLAELIIIKESKYGQAVAYLYMETILSEFEINYGK